MKGQIVSNNSNLYQVEVENKIIECNVKGKFKQTDLVPVVGDFVQIEIKENEDKKGIICEILDRKTYSKRPKLANLTQIILVVSLKTPKPDFLLLDKQLTYAEYLGIKPIICINKIDLGDEKIIREIHRIYENVGYIVIDTNAKEQIGIDKLKTLLKDNITAFSGNSGVGKSTLINGLFKNSIAQEGNLSQKLQRGKNTTTNTTLYKINGGYIADTPGFSTFDVQEIESKDLDKYFIEFKGYLDKCEYGDCNHIKEENCAIKNAVLENKIDKDRYNRYIKIFNELKEKEAHKW